jgi:4-amino-4-deoxy-L-arabinose transferase-like glycosyltransferase
VTLPRWRLKWWASPADQPRWARPGLLALAAIAAAAYSWRLGSSTEVFYAAAARSMSTSLHNFFFGAFDPAGTISIDKLPGAFWVQALSIQLFGARTWALAVPQVVEGVLCVLVLFRAVRRCAGPVAAIVAAAVLAIAPATVTLDRGNVADTLLVLLLVLAADSLVAAIDTGRRANLLLAGVWVGLAFQAKMLEAWLILPALALVFVVAGRGGFVERVAWCAAMVAAAMVVSVSWMAVVSLTPSRDRPYVDGTTNDSVVSQVFRYNGFGRVGRPSPNQTLGRTLGITFLAAPAPRASVTRLFTGTAGRDTGWLLPAAALSVPALLWERRRRPRTDLQRAAVLLWGAWLVVFGCAFSVTAINSYYLGALSPPIAAMIGIAGSTAWAHRHARHVQGAVAVVVLLSAIYAVWLLPSSGTGLPGWLAWAMVALGVVALGCIAVFAASNRRVLAAPTALAAGAALLVVPFVASVSVVTNDLGVFDTPFQPRAATSFNKSFFGAPLHPIATLPAIERAQGDSRYLMAAQTSVIAAPFIFATGEEVVPLGGYDGTTPEPTVDGLQNAIARGEFRLVLTAPRSADPRVVWIKTHCLAVRPTGPPPPVALDVSYCLPAARR